MHRIHSWIVCGLVPLVLLAGCSQSGHELAPVNGRITLDGQPVVSAMVMFQPESKGSPSYGSTDQDGRYQLGYSRTQQGT